MTLEKAYNIGLKYGFTFNEVGPSLSMIDGKVGICINLLDDNFGYIRRNYSFDNETEYEEFLKKYTYYLHNRESENIFITLENYLDMDAKIIYSYENEDISNKEIEFQNKELLLKDIKSFLVNFIDSLELLRGDIAEKLLVEQDYYNKLDYYQRLLYKTFDMEYEEEVMHADKSYLDTFNESVKSFDLNHRRDLASVITENTTMDVLNEMYTKLYHDCQAFLNNEDYLNTLFDKKRFKNNIDSLDAMIEYLLNHPEVDDNTEEELAKIKEQTIEVDFEEFKKQYHNKYLKKFDNIEDSYNEKIFGAEKVEYLEFSRKSISDEKKIVDLKYLYDNLDDDQKIAVGLIQSPLKSIVLYVIEQAYLKNQKFDFEREDFKDIYNELITGLKNSENLVFRLKYFKNISTDSYEEFIKSIVKTAKLICTAYNKLPFDLKLYSLNYESCMMCASDSAIKNGTNKVNIIEAHEGCSYIYSPIKIVYDKDNNTYSTKENNNIIYFPKYLNMTKDKDESIVLNLYELSYKVEQIADKNLLIISGFDLDKAINYEYSDMFAKEKE